MGAQDGQRIAVLTQPAGLEAVGTNRLSRWRHIHMEERVGVWREEELRTCRCDKAVRVSPR